MYFKAILSLVIFLIILPFCGAQQTEDREKAKEYYFGALTFYEEKSYDNALFSLKKAEDHLGKTNARIEGLAVKILFAQNKKEETQKRIVKYYQQIDIKLVPKLEREVASIKIKIEESSNLTTNVNMSFEDTLAYIQDNLNDVPQTVYSAPHTGGKQNNDGTFKVAKLTSVYEFSHLSSCKIIIKSSVENSYSKTLRRESYNIDLSSINKIILTPLNHGTAKYVHSTGASVLFHAGIRERVKHKFKDDSTYANYEYNKKLVLKEAAKVGAIFHETPDEDETSAFNFGNKKFVDSAVIYIESENQGTKFLKAFRNLKSTCPKDPFS